MSEVQLRARAAATPVARAVTPDLALLGRLGWDDEVGVFRPDPAHPLLGYQVCRVGGCGNEATGREGLCNACSARRVHDPAEDLASFVARSSPSPVRRGERLCLVCRVPGSSRPAGSNGLCFSCDHLRRTRAQGVECYVTGDDTYSPAAPRPTIGTCTVMSCDRLAARVANGLCDAHDQAWRKEGRPDLAVFSRKSTPRQGDRSGRVVLRGLPEVVITEFLYGIELSVAEGRRLPPTVLRSAAQHLRRLEVTSILGAPVAGLRQPVRCFLELIGDRMLLAEADVASERTKDVWDLRIWGQHGRLSFVGGAALPKQSRTPALPITQEWLKSAAKEWAADALASKTGPTVRNVLGTLGVFSEYLRRRDDHGEVLAALSRIDLEGFLARLGRLEAAGSLSAYARRRNVDLLGQFFREARATGLTRPGRVLSGLADEITVRRSDHPAPLRADGESVGRALPDPVMSQLLSEESLVILERLAGPTGRAAVELLAGVGRRTAELCGLRFACLDYDTTVDADGEMRRSPVLVHDMPKVGKVGCRLPIHEREARIITAQQARVRACFPETTPDRLVLFPRPLTNPDGTRSVSTQWLQRTMRAWVDSLPPIETPRGHAKPVAFPNDAITPYAFRHSFAQRHADSGTPVDTLRELLGHDTVRTTLGYYRVTARRKRAAQDALGPLQLDASARRLRPTLTGLAQTEALREEIGQVAVPFGICTEPTNVAAEGGSCPFRHRCVGCEYFRTDPSYQPELSAYLAQLLADRERLAAALPQLAEWARSDAAPSEEEIDAVRRLIVANDEALARLDDDDRRAVESAVATVRRARAAMNTTFPIHLRGLTRQAMPSLFPTIERVAASEASSA